MGLSASAYARHRGVSHVAVLKAIKAGRIAWEPDGTIDPIKADAAWAENTNHAQQRNNVRQSKPHVRPTESGPVNGGPSFAQSRAIREAYNARLAKLEYEERSQILVRTDTVKVAWFNVLRVLRDRTLNLADRLAPILAAETDAKIVREKLDSELRQILDDASSDITNISTGSET